MKCIHLFCFLLALIANSVSYKILVIFPHVGKSHLDVFIHLVEQLVNRGHEITLISYENTTIPNENFKQIVLSNANLPSTGVLDIKSLRDRGGWHRYTVVEKLFIRARDSCENGLSHPEIQKLAKTYKEKKFDLILLEFFNTDCFLVFAHLFKAPFIGLSSTTVMPWTNPRFANNDNPSYIPNNHMQYGSQMDFFQRLDNFIGTLVYKFYYNYYIIHSDDHMAKKYFDPRIKVSDLAKNASLLLVNSHFTFTFPRPLVPGVVEVGGIHIDKNRKASLPKDIEKFINESKAGVIYFSLGSLIKGHTFPEDKRREFLKAFSRIPQRVLWKWENETMPGKPDNVMIQKWMPQLDILCHPNVKAFISHGGLLGLTEAVHCGVPTVVMPQFGDQYTNAKALEANGGGVILDLSEATEELVYNALQTVLNPKFHQQAKELSERFRDRPMSPMDTAIYWVEYVARHKGAYHMRTAAVDMPLYQYLLLDVISFILVVLLLVFYIIYKLLKFVISLFVKPTKLKKQ